jgi:CheY-like chemotaxis protein
MGVRVENSKTTAQQPMSAANGPGGAKPRLLIVEDELMVAWALAQATRDLGWKICATVTTQEAAVEAASHLKPDAILMDYQLGDGGNGLDAARRIREATDVPIIFCTAYVDGLSSEVPSVPRAQLIAKPVRPSILRQALAWATGDGNRASMPD